MVSLWLPFYFSRAAAARFSARPGAQGWPLRLGGECDVQTRWGRALVASRWSRGLYAALKVRVLLLPRTRTGADARAGRFAGTIAGETH